MDVELDALRRRLRPTPTRLPHPRASKSPLTSPPLHCARGEERGGLSRTPKGPTRPGPWFQLGLRG